MALRIARRDAVGVATHPVPCTSQNVVQNSSASKTKKVTSTSHTKFFVSPCVFRGLIQVEHKDWLLECSYIGVCTNREYRYVLIFAGLNFRGLPIFAVFAFLFSRFVT